MVHGGKMGSATPVRNLKSKTFSLILCTLHIVDPFLPWPNGVGGETGKKTGTGRTGCGGRHSAGGGLDTSGSWRLKHASHQLNHLDE